MFLKKNNNYSTTYSTYWLTCYLYNIILPVVLYQLPVVIIIIKKNSVDRIFQKHYFYI